MRGQNKRLWPTVKLRFQDEQYKFHPSYGAVDQHAFIDTWSFHIQSACALWTWRRLPTVSLGEPCRRCCGNIGYQDCCCEPFGSYTTAVRAMFVFSAVSWTCSRWVLGSTRADPCLPSCLWFSWRESQHARGRRVSALRTSELLLCFLWMMCFCWP